MQRELSGLHSARASPYRVVYRIDEDHEAIVILRVDHRSDVNRPRLGTEQVQLGLTNYPARPRAVEPDRIATDLVDLNLEADSSSDRRRGRACVAPASRCRMS